MNLSIVLSIRDFGHKFVHSANLHNFLPYIDSIEKENHLRPLLEHLPLLEQATFLVLGLPGVPEATDFEFLRKKEGRDGQAVDLTL